jgi:cellulose synthase/poly-beta-1,6-N-acetylglucosamine synthase-like glycosyltransferase
MMKNPGVSLIVPYFNEQARSSLLLDAIRVQKYPLDDIEVVIADGMSDGGTREAFPVCRLNLDMSVNDPVITEAVC